MSEGNSGPDQKDCVRILKIVVVILSASAVILSALSVFYFAQAKDYHDAKYRAQWVLMNDLLESSDGVSILLDSVAGYAGSTIEHRAIDAESLQGALHSMIDSAWAVREMYMNDKEKNETFYMLGQAMETILDNALSITYSLGQNVTEEVPYSENATMNDALHDASSIVVGLHAAFHQSFKVDPKEDEGRSWERHPYSLVNRLNLQYVRTSSVDIMALF